MNRILKEIGWVLLYICFFGISDYVVRNFIKNDYHFLFYYIFIGILGFIAVFN